MLVLPISSSLPKKKLVLGGPLSWGKRAPLHLATMDLKILKVTKRTTREIGTLEDHNWSIEERMLELDSFLLGFKECCGVA